MGRVKPSLRLEDISDNTPLRLAVAADIAFPDGSISASSLRKERDAGRLTVERIAGKEYTTLANIQEMRRLCRDQAKDHSSGRSQQRSEAMAEQEALSGSLKTAPLGAAQASAQRMVEKLRQKKPNKLSPTTSRKSTSQPANKVVPLHQFPSRT